MARTAHFHVTIDTTHNCLRLGLHGDIDAACMKSCVDEVVRAAAALASGFKVLTDLSGIHSMDTACVPEVERLMDQCRDKGVGTIIRVIPRRSRDVGFSILSLFHYPKNVRIITCATAAEAEQKLSGL